MSELGIWAMHGLNSDVHGASQGFPERSKTRLPHCLLDCKPKLGPSALGFSVRMSAFGYMLGLAF